MSCKPDCPARQLRVAIQRWRNSRSFRPYRWTTIVCDPGELVDAVGEWWAENVVVAFREEAAALVHLDKRVAALHRFELVREIARGAVADVPVIEVVRRAHEDRRILLRCVLWMIDVSRDLDAVAHRDH